MNENTLIATFSAVGQSLAAIVAILMAIIVIRLSALETDIARAHQILESLSPSAEVESAQDILREKGVKGLINTKVQFDYADANMSVPLNAGQRAWKSQIGLIRAVWIVLTPSFFLIAGCLVALPFVPHLKERSKLSGWLVGLTLGLAICCLAGYAWLMVRLVASP
jgi:hypothetical protein